MQVSEYFKKNIEKWARLCPEASALLLQLECHHTDFATTGLGDLNLKKIDENSIEYLHSTESVNKEANDWFASLDLHNTSLLYVYGIGLGYYWDIAKKWLQEDSTRYLVFIESDLEVIHRLFETEKGSEILNDKQVKLHYFDKTHPNNQLFETLARIFIFKEFKISALASYVEKHADFLSGLPKTFEFWQNLHSMTTFEQMSHGQQFFKNFYQNLSFLPDSYRANALFGKFQNIPAIICGAGPSLDKNIDLLKQLSDRALIFSGGTALNALNAHDFLPHFGLGIDPNDSQKTRLIMNQSYELPFLYRNRMNHDALSLVHGPRLYVNGSGGYRLSEWFEEKLGLTGKIVDEGFNVVNFNISTAIAMGCNPIILVGVDLAYSNDKPYPDCIISHPTHSLKNDFKTKSITDELLIKTDINGNPVHTLWKWVNESFWFSQAAQFNPQITFINATEGGIGFEGIPNLTLADVADRYLLTSMDIRSLVHGEIENGTMPEGVNKKKITEHLNDFSDSLKHCQEYYECMRHEFKKNIQLVEELKEIPEDLFTDKAKDCLKKLETEPAYNYLLKDFNTEQLALFELDFQQLIHEKGSTKESELTLRKINIYTKIYIFLADSIAIHLFLIQQMLEMARNESEQPVQLNAIKTRQIADPKVGSCQEKGDELYQLYYPNGSIKMSCFYRSSTLKNQPDPHKILHGPSTFFNPEGKILSKSLFIHGKREGLSELYYQSGALYSKQQFCHGVWDGTQEFYYKDGSYKTILHYRNGKLDGDVELYYPNGNIKRELHFSEGKKTGVERMWSEKSLLIMQAEYQKGKPVGPTRQWHDNGNLALEIIYDAESRASKSCKWDNHGSIITENKQANDDYFDKASKQTAIFAQSLLSVFENLEELVPLLTTKTKNNESKKFSDNELTPGNDLTNDFLKLKDTMDHLQSLKTKMDIVSGVYQEETSEPIWKTPSSQKQVEKIITDSEKVFTEQLNTIQKMILDMGESLNNKNEI